MPLFRGRILPKKAPVLRQMEQAKPYRVGFSEKSGVGRQESIIFATDKEMLYRKAREMHPTLEPLGARKVVLKLRKQ